MALIEMGSEPEAVEALIVSLQLFFVVYYDYSSNYIT